MNRREKLQEMLKSNPGDPFLHYGMAMEHRKAGNFPDALACLERAIECDADYVAAYFHSGQILAEQSDAASARRMLRTGIEVAGRLGDGHAIEEMTGLLETLE